MKEIPLLNKVSHLGLTCAEPAEDKGCRNAIWRFKLLKKCNILMFFLCAKTRSGMVEVVDCKKVFNSQSSGNLKHSIETR